MSELTFAEAMALDPSEVEVLGEVYGWQLLATDLSHWSLDYLRTAKFRRAKPKRSRVQEMASNEDLGRAELVAMAIRAVCEYMRPRFDGAAYLVEREFLDTR
jgi:hypothetical protein